MVYKYIGTLFLEELVNTGNNCKDLHWHFSLIMLAFSTSAFFFWSYSMAKPSLLHKVEKIIFDKEEFLFNIYQYIFPEITVSSNK